MSDEPTSEANGAESRAGASGLDGRPPVEIGWVLVGDFDVGVRAAIDRARLEVLAELRRLSQFRFDIPVRRRAAPREIAVEPISLIDIGALELDAARWDFTVVFTAAELRSYDKPFSFGAPASSLNVAALSTARLAVDGADGEADDRLAHRVAGLFLHLFGHLNDLGHSDDPEGFMHDPEAEVDLDRMKRFSDAECDLLGEDLAREADERIEERGSSVSTLRFYLEASWDNRSDIYNAFMKIRPWRFFASFSRLTTTAVSAMVVLLITAEAWDMGVRQPVERVFVAGALAIALTTGYVLRRQKLLERLRHRGLTEQKVIANVSVTLAVLVGMTTTYVLLFASAFVFTEVLQPEALLRDWVPEELWPVGPTRYLTMCAFVATLGVLLGALGASFESETYFRHVVLVDEET